MNQKQIEELIKAFAPLRKSLCRKFSYLDPEDLDQDLIILTIEGLKTYDQEASQLPYYIKKICSWYCLDKVKRKENQLSLDYQDQEGLDLKEKLASKENLEEDLENKEEKDYIREKIKQLDEKERTLIEGHYYQNKSLKEIGRQMDLSAASISRIHKKALKKLKKNLGQIKKDL